MTKTSDHRSKHHSGNQSTLVEHVRTRAEQEQHHDERTHDDQVPLVQSGIPEHGSTHPRLVRGGDVPFPGQNVPLGMSWSASAAAKRRLPA